MTESKLWREALEAGSPASSPAPRSTTSSVLDDQASWWTVPRSPRRSDWPGSCTPPSRASSGSARRHANGQAADPVVQVRETVAE